MKLVSLNSFFPKVSLISAQKPDKSWDLVMVSEGKEQPRMMELAMSGHTNVKVMFDNCRYICAEKCPGVQGNLFNKNIK